MTLTWMLERSARMDPTKPAIIGEHRSVSYGELLDASRRAAAVFRSAGVQPGDRVGVMTYNTPSFAIAAFGVWRAGATLVPINHKFMAPEVEYVARHAGVDVIVSDVDFIDRVRVAAPSARVLVTTDDGTGEFDTLVAAAEGWDGVTVPDDAIAQILYTSGTTNSPKGCMHTHAGLTNVAAFSVATVSLQREDRFLIAMPIWHSSPLNNWFLSMIFLGATVVFLKEYHPVKFLQTVQEHRVTAFFGAPIAYLAPLKVLPGAGLSMSDFDLSSVRLWAYGGAPLGAQTVKTLTTAYGSDSFYQVYGMSEMGPVGTALYPAEQTVKAGSIGRGGMPGVDIRVMNPDGSPVRAGEVGEL